MPVRDLTVLFQIMDKVSGVLDPILNKLDALDGRQVVASADMDTSGAVAGASALESSLDSLQGANEKVAGSLEKVAGAEQKEGKAAEDGGKKTKKSGDEAKYAAGLYGQLQRTLDTTAQKFDHLKDKIDPIRGKLLAVQATLIGMATVAVYSTAKTQSLVEELKGLKGEGFAAPLIEWANKGSDLDYTSKSQRLTIATDLSDLDYNVADTKKYGEEIEKFYFQKTGALKRYGIASAAELAKTMAAAEKSGNLESVKRLFSSGAVSEEKLGKEMTRLRVNYEKFAFATDEVVKKQAMHNLMMKELQKTNQSFTGQAVTLEQKLDVLQGKFSGLLSGIGGKLEPVAEKVADALISIIDGIEAIPAHDEILTFLGALIVVLTSLMTLAAGLAPVFVTLSSLSKLGAVTTLVGGLGGVSAALGGIAAAGAAALAPLLPVIAVLAVIAGALYLVYTRTTILQDGFATLKDYMGRAMSAAQKLWSLVSGGLRGNKSDLKEIGDWIKDFLDGLIPGWMSDLFGTAQSYYREAMKWFDRIMGWWNSFLKKVTDVYDKVKSILGLGAEDKEGVESPIQPGGETVPAGYSRTFKTPDNKWVTEGWARQNIPEEQWPQLKDSGWFNGRDIRSYMDKGRLLGTAEETDQEGKYAPSEIAKRATESIEEVADAGVAAVQESGQTYVDNSAKTYQEQIDNGASYTQAAHAAYDPLGFYTDLGKKGLNYLGLGGDEEKLPAGAVGATVDQSGAMIVHEKEELVPARITSGAGKLAGLLGAALDFMAGKSDIEKEISERMIQQQEISSSTSQMGGVVIQSMPITINPIVNLSVAQAMDISRLDVTKLIDWSRVSYELEKVVKATFRTQEG